MLPSKTLLRLCGRPGPGLLVGVLLAVAAAAPVTAQPLVVTHVRPESDVDTRDRYFIDLLDLVLRKTEGPYRLATFPTKMQQSRALAQLVRGESIDVAWAVTSKERERDLLPIRIPLFKGLIGVRLLLINKADEDVFDRIRTCEALKVLRAGQGHDWPDTEILRHNGFTVAGNASYEALFKMLEKRRIDYFPRSIVEIRAEAERHAEKGLVVDDAIVLHYPSAVYFFVNKQNRVLAARLEEGLRRAVADGSFDRLFYRRFGDAIEQARLKDRLRFDLENPLLTPETPLDRPELWYQY